jgi:AcrR family transcriptional regulator
MRKQLRARRDLQRAAIRLVEARGYGNVSVEDICAEAEVSRSTFFRYFGTKTAVFEADMVEEVASEKWPDTDKSTLPGLLELIRATYTELTADEFDQERRRIVLLQTTPELRGSFANELVRPLAFLVSYVARMLDQPPDAQRVRTVAGAVFGALATMQLPDRDGIINLPASREEAVAKFEATFSDLLCVLDPEATAAEFHPGGSPS